MTYASPVDDRPALLARISELEADLAWWRSGAGPTDVALFLAIHQATGDENVRARDVAEMAGRSVELQVALVTALGVEWNIRSLGKRFAKFEAETLGGVQIRNIGDSGRGDALWSVRKLAGFGGLETRKACGGE